MLYGLEKDCAAVRKHAHMLCTYTSNVAGSRAPCLEGTSYASAGRLKVLHFSTLLQEVYPVDSVRFPLFQDCGCDDMGIWNCYISILVYRSYEYPWYGWSMHGCRHLFSQHSSAAFAQICESFEMYAEKVHQMHICVELHEHALERLSGDDKKCMKGKVELHMSFKLQFSEAFCTPAGMYNRQL